MRVAVILKKHSRFVAFGSDQDCHCGAVCCKKKLGAKASKTNNIPSDEDVNLTACKVVTRKRRKVKQI